MFKDIEPIVQDVVPKLKKVKEAAIRKGNFIDFGLGGRKFAYQDYYSYRVLLSEAGFYDGMRGVQIIMSSPPRVDIAQSLRGPRIVVGGLLRGSGLHNISEIVIIKATREGQLNGFYKSFNRTSTATLSKARFNNDPTTEIYPAEISERALPLRDRLDIAGLIIPGLTGELDLQELLK